MQSLDKEGILRELNRAERKAETSTIVNSISALNASQTATILEHLG